MTNRVRSLCTPGSVGTRGGQPPWVTRPLGLGDAGELVLFVGGDLHGVLEPLVKGLILRLLLGQWPLKFVAAGPGLTHHFS